MDRNAIQTYRQEDWVGAGTGFSLDLLAKSFGKQFRPYCEKLDEAEFQF